MKSLSFTVVYSIKNSRKVKSNSHPPVNFRQVFVCFFSVYCVYVRFIGQHVFFFFAFVRKLHVCKSWLFERAYGSTWHCLRIFFSEGATKKFTYLRITYVMQWRYCQGSGLAVNRSWVQVLTEHHCVMALGELLTPVCLCHQAV